MHNKKIIAKGLVFVTTVVNVPIDSLANTIEEVKITNVEDNTKDNAREGEAGNSIKKFFAKIVEPIEDLVSESKSEIKVNKNIVRGSVLEINLSEGEFVENLAGNPGGYETVKVTTTGDKKLVAEDYNNLRTSGIANIDLSNSISDYITISAFSGASHLVSFKFPQGVTIIDASAFRDCTGLTGDLVIPDTVKTIGSNAFKGCSGFNGELTIPNSVTSINDYSFTGCSGLVGSLVIPDSVINIGLGAFSDCSGFNGSLKLSNSLTNMRDGAFQNCSGFVGDLIIPDSLISISAEVFNGCSGFNGELVLPNTLESIKGNAFKGCSRLIGSLVIPESVTTIESGAFYECSGFTGDLIIPNSVTYLGNNVFSNCSGFDGELILSNSLERTGGMVFSNCSNLKGSLVIPSSLTSLSYNLFSGCSGFTGDLVIPDSVTEIRYDAFNGCSGFDGRLVLPTSLVKIGASAFRGCSSLVGTLSLPNSLVSIDNGAFAGCVGFTGDLIIPNSIANIGSDLFYNCSGFDGNLIIPETITSIGTMAFYGCIGLTGDLIIPDSVTFIGNYAFYKCSGFTGKLKISNSVTSINAATFLECGGFTGDLIIPDSVTTIENSAFNKCGGFNGVLSLPKSLVSIGNGSFGDCVGLTGDLIIPDTVTTIGGSTFSNCKGFNGSLYLSKSLETLGNFVFSGCSGFTGNLVIPDSLTSVGMNIVDTNASIEKIFIKVNSSDLYTNYRENILKGLPNMSKVVIDVPHDFDVTGTWLESTRQTVGRPVLKAVVDGIESELVGNKGDIVSLYIPSLYKEVNIPVLKDGKAYTLPVRNSDGKHMFTEPGIYQVTITTDLGNTSIINFEVEDPTIKEIEENLREMETIKKSENISATRELINSLPESMVKDQLQEQLNNIFPDIELEKKTVSANLDVYIKSENMLSLSLDTNSITFEEYSGAEPMEKLNAVNLTINSSLPYNLNAYMPTEISNSDGTEKIDIDILNIRESNEGVYKQFEDTTNKLILKENCQKGNNINHSIDLKLDSSDSHVADIYKTVIKFEAEQK